MTEEEIKASINSLDDEEVKKAYCEMISLAQEEEANRNWHEPWKKKSQGLF